MAESNNVNEAGGSGPPIGDDEEVLQLGDIIKHQDDMMEEVAAVLGAGDDFNCSYFQGYVKRQALYACLTCVPQGRTDFTKAAGFCLACSYHCHDGHNLIELYTKRHFRCDCGNLKFGDVHCNLDANKEDYNYENVYNQNFSGLYCTCQKPYPDPEDPIEDDMIQCIICEDWYHSRHLNAAAVDDFAEMICETCVKTHAFLMNYIGMALTKVEAAQKDETVNVVTVTEAKQEEAMVTNGTDTQEEQSKSECDAMQSDSCEPAETNEHGVSENGTSKKNKSEKTAEESAGKSQEQKEAAEMVCNVVTAIATAVDPNCVMPVIKDSAKPRTLFMKELKWRDALCKCTTCMQLYKEHEVLYLLDMEDTVEMYERKGKEKYQDAKQKAIEAEQQILKSMPRAPLLNAMAGFNDFKQQLSEYLKQFADQKKVLTVDDVKEFFSKLNSNKRQKTSESTYFCR